MNRIVVMLVCLLVTTVRAEPPKEIPSEKKDAVAKEAYALAQVACDPELGLANFDMLLPLIQTEGFHSRVLHALAKSVKAEDARPFDVNFKIYQIPPGEESNKLPPGLTYVLLYGASSDERVSPQQVVWSFRDELLRHLAEMWQRQEKEREGALQQAQEEYAALDGELFRRKLRQMREGRFAYGTVEKLEEQQARLQQEVQTLELELQGLNARQQVMEKQVAALSEKIQAAADHDPVVRRLSQAVSLQRELVGKLDVSKKENETAIVKLAEMEAELERSRREAVVAAGGHRLTDLQQRLEDVAIDRAEAEAKRQELQKSLEQAVPTILRLGESEQSIEQIKRVQRGLEVKIERRQQRIGHYPEPSVTILGFQRETE